MNPMDPNTPDMNDMSSGNRQFGEQNRVEEPSLADADVSGSDEDTYGGRSQGNGAQGAAAKAEAIRHRVAVGLESAANKLRPQEGTSQRLDSVRRTLATRIEGAALQIDQANISDLTRSASEAARKYPLGVLAVGVGLGLLTGRMLKR